MNGRLRYWLSSVACSLALVAVYALSYSITLERRHESHAARPSDAGIWMLPDTALKALAGEFKGLMSDYLTMEAGAQLGARIIRDGHGGFKTAETQHNWHSVLRLFQAAQALDPSFAQTFLLAQGWLPWPPADLVRETQDFLQISARHRPWDWQPLRTMGFNAFYFNHDKAGAARAYLEAAQRPNAPSFLAILGARLGQEAGETETAILMMRSMLLGKAEDEPGYRDLAQRLQALQGALSIERARDAFLQAHKRLPQDLNQLLQSGFLAAMPANPYKVPYCLDAAGQVFFDRQDCSPEEAARP